MSVWTRPAASSAVLPRAQAARPHLVPADRGEERDQAEQLVGGAHDLRRARRARGPSSARIAAASSGSSSRQLRLVARADGDRAARGERGGQRLALADVRDHQRRLRGQQVRPPAAPAARRAGSSTTARQSSRLGARPPRRRRAPPCSALSSRRSAVSRSASSSSVSTVSRSATGIDLAVRMRDLRMLERAHDVQRPRRRRGCGRGSGCRAPRPCARRARGPAMSTNSICSGTRRSIPSVSPIAVEPLVRHRHDRDVRIDGRERILGRLRRRARERVEERRLAGVRQADDADLHRHLPTRAARNAVALGMPRAALRGCRLEAREVRERVPSRRSNAKPRGPARSRSFPR